MSVLLNPHGYSPNEMFAQNMVYEGLVDYTENGVIPNLQIADISDDGKVYTFDLRKTLCFQMVKNLMLMRLS